MGIYRRNWSLLRTLAPILALAAVLTVSGTPQTSATTPGSNGRIAFKGYLDGDRSTGAIFNIRPNGSRVRQITHPSDGTVDDQPDWSPDGALIAFRRCVPDVPCAIYTVQSDGTHLRRLTPVCNPTPPDTESACPDESEVAFLPDSRRVVFTRSTGRVRDFPNGQNYIEHSDIVIRDLAGDRERVVLRSRPFAGDNHEVVVSPDGRRIAFVRQNSPLAEPADGIATFVMRINGTHIRRITAWDLRAGDHPDWSPNGRWILVRSNEDGGFLDSQLYLLHPNGSGLRQITNVSGTAMLLSASFSPNGKRITFAQTGRGGQPDIFTMRLNGRHERQVTDTDLWESAPDWGTRPTRASHQ